MFWCVCVEGGSRVLSRARCSVTGTLDIYWCLYVLVVCVEGESRVLSRTRCSVTGTLDIYWCLYVLVCVCGGGI